MNPEIIQINPKSQHCMVSASTSRAGSRKAKVLLVLQFPPFLQCTKSQVRVLDVATACIHFLTSIVRLFPADVWQGQGLLSLWDAVQAQLRFFQHHFDNPEFQASTALLYCPTAAGLQCLTSGDPLCNHIEL